MKSDQMTMLYQYCMDKEHPDNSDNNHLCRRYTIHCAFTLSRFVLV